jgi:hypothetical protein
MSFDSLSISGVVAVDSGSKVVKVRSDSESSSPTRKLTAAPFGLSRLKGKSGSSLASATGPRLTLLDLTLRNGRSGGPASCFEGEEYVGRLKLRTGDLSDATEALRFGGETEIESEAGAKTSSLCESMYDWRKFLISSCRERPMFSRRSAVLMAREGVCWKVFVVNERWKGCPLVVGILEVGVSFLLMGAAKPPMG